MSVIRTRFRSMRDPVTWVLVGAQSFAGAASVLAVLREACSTRAVGASVAGGEACGRAVSPALDIASELWTARPQSARERLRRTPSGAAEVMHHHPAVPGPEFEALERHDRTRYLLRSPNLLDVG